MQQYHMYIYTPLRIYFMIDLDVRMITENGR